jgi:hypothetical protein
MIRKLFRKKETKNTPNLITEIQAEEYFKQRDTIYQEYFGNQYDVYHEVIPYEPHIDILTFPPGHQNRNYFTMVTSGMSDLNMQVPEDCPDDPVRVELIFYCSVSNAEYKETLRTIAHFPHDYKTWIGPGHTIPNGDPPQPVWESLHLEYFLFLPALVNPEYKLGEKLIIQEIPVHFLWLVPISSSECEFLWKNGLRALLDVFKENNYLPVYDPGRKSFL